MRWRAKRHPQNGDIRFVWRFLWWPTQFYVLYANEEQVVENRWLEWVSVKQEFWSDPVIDKLRGKPVGYWRDRGLGSV